METESSWFELAGIIFFTWMVIIVGLLWGLSIKASYNEEKQRQKQIQENRNGKSKKENT
ncbi:hypothetical protein [Sulfurihydrogenibium sp.]|uniref:hypothetical protein n=1 Tax=Sulfurihydrogenibium sp. TaxID=2053621 RepID=UPI00261C4B54|nr:hypothetical protein [Sulfurihydrogenibium sp.]